MPDTKLLNQCGAVAEHSCGGLRTHERCDGIGLVEKNQKSDQGGIGVSSARCFR